MLNGVAFGAEWRKELPCNILLENYFPKEAFEA
jgi:hypothetical protein